MKSYRSTILNLNFATGSWIFTSKIRRIPRSLFKFLLNVYFCYRILWIVDLKIRAYHAILWGLDPAFSGSTHPAQAFSRNIDSHIKSSLRISEATGRLVKGLLRSAHKPIKIFFFTGAFIFWCNFPRCETCRWKFITTLRALRSPKVESSSGSGTARIGSDRIGPGRDRIPPIDEELLARNQLTIGAE